MSEAPIIWKRKDLLGINGRIFVGQGSAIQRNAARAASFADRSICSSATSPSVASPRPARGSSRPAHGLSGISARPARLLAAITGPVRLSARHNQFDWPVARAMTTP